MIAEGKEMVIYGGSRVQLMECGCDLQADTNVVVDFFGPND